MHGSVAGDVPVTAGRMSTMKEVQAEFEARYRRIFRAYAPLLRKEEPALVSYTSAIKGLAWNCYLQGRTDEMAQQLAQEKRLHAAKLTALVRRSRHDAVR